MVMMIMDIQDGEVSNGEWLLLFEISSSALNIKSLTRLVKAPATKLYP